MENVNMNIDIQKMKDNVRLYTKYRTLGYDVLFYYAICVLYFTVAKGLTMSEVLFLTGVYTLALALWQLVSNIIVERIGLKNSIVLGNALVCIMLFIYLIAPQYNFFIIANVIGALGMALKAIGESTILFESLSILKKPSLFTKFEGIANSRHFFLDAISSVVAGLLFLISPYIPMIACLVCMILALYYSTKFFPTNNITVKHIKLKEYVIGIKEVIHSKRALAILFFSFLISGIILAHTTLYKAIILDFNISADMLAYIVCGYTIVIGVGSNFGKLIERIFKNRTLIFTLIILAVMLAIIGIIGLAKTFSIFNMSVILLSLIVIGIIVGAYRVLIRKYITSFTTSKVRTKIASLYSMAENLGGTVLLFLSSAIVNYASSAFAAICIACLVLIIGILVNKYANKYLGLKPEQYAPKDIYYIDINVK